MKPSLSEQLKDVKLDASEYSRLPMKEDVLVFKDGKKIVDQWDKLNYLQKHLKTIDWYIRKNQGETLQGFLAQHRAGVSDIVLKAIGGHNNETGGISAYFLNLQNFYDEQEALYDEMELKAEMPSDIQNALKDLREARLEKRTTRRKVRKIKLKDLKSDGKGYLMVNIEEPPTETKEEEKKEGAEQKKDPATTEEKKTAGEMVDAAIGKSKKNIAVWIAGAIITIGVVGFIANSSNSGAAK